MPAIAIYEPDDLMKSLLVEWLSQAGYTVHQSVAPQAERDQPVDLVVASIHSPRREGSGVLGAIRMTHPRTPLIALSSHFRCGLPSVGSAAQALGVARVLPKPLTRHELLAAIQALIGPGGEDGIVRSP